MATQSFTVNSNTKFSPFTGQPINAPVGTVIYGDQSLGKDYGTSPNPPSSSAFDIPPTSTYGQTRDANLEQPALMEEQGIQSGAIQSGLIDPQFLTKITSDPNQLAFYINALAYGGYTMGDVLNDMKRRELVSQGNAQASNLKIIDPEVTRSNYLGSADGQKSVTDTANIIPTFNLQGIMDPNILKYGSNIPDQLFTQLVPTLDKNSQEFKDAVAGVKSAFYDLSNAQLQATTEQDKAVADYNYNQFKTQIEKQYGVILSNDATQAWKQIDNLKNTFADRNLGGSGLQNEAIDQTLRSVRKYDQYARESKLTQEDAQMAATYKASATPEQIQQLIAEDKAKGLPQDQWRATLWGLTPSADIAAKYDMATLQKEYPNETPEQLQAYRNSVLDENGNYRSTIYSNYYSNIATNNASQKATAETTVMNDALNKEKTAYANYDQTQPFSKATTADNTQVQNDASKAPNSPNQPVIPATDNSSIPPVISSTSSPTTNQPAVNPAVSTSTTPTSTNTSSETIKQMQRDLNQKNAGQPGWVALTVDGVLGPKTQAAQNFKPTASVVPPTSVANQSTPFLNYSPVPVPASVPNATPITPQSAISTAIKPVTNAISNIVKTLTPSSTSTTSNSIPAPSSYKIASGDTLSSIAAKNNTTVATLAKINNISDPNKIQAGQTIKFS